jgi:hypothetical protein
MDGLTLQQRKVVEAGGGAWLVLAGAGTGKTRALVHRVARLLALGVAPSRVCLVTFSQRAAANMRAQLEALGVAEGVRAGTFHALALEALRRRGGALGWSGAFSVLGEVEATRAMQGCAERVGLGGHGAKVARLQERCAQQGWGVAQGVEALWPEARGLEEALWGAFEGYARWKAEARALDFGDLLLGWSRLAGAWRGGRGGARLGGRVPGRQPAPSALGGAIGAPPRERDGGGRRRAGHLWVPGGQRPRDSWASPRAVRGAAGSCAWRRTSEGRRRWWRLPTPRCRSSSVPKRLRAAKARCLGRGLRGGCAATRPKRRASWPSRSWRCAARG